MYVEKQIKEPPTAFLAHKCTTYPPALAYLVLYIYRKQPCSLNVLHTYKPHAKYYSNLFMFTKVIA